MEIERLAPFNRLRAGSGSRNLGLEERREGPELIQDYGCVRRGSLPVPRPQAPPFLLRPDPDQAMIFLPLPCFPTHQPPDATPHPAPDPGSTSFLTSRLPGPTSGSEGAGASSPEVPPPCSGAEHSFCHVCSRRELKNPDAAHAPPPPPSMADPADSYAFSPFIYPQVFWSLYGPTNRYAIEKAKSDYL